MVTEKEGEFNVGGKSLYTKTWLPDGPTLAKLVFIHGFSDHMGRYYGFFPSLAARGIAVYGFDQRGWGRSCLSSPKEKGLTGPTSLVLSDIAAFLTPHLPSSPSDPPVFVMGHSMGGGQALTFACDPQYEELVRKVRGWLLESPFIGFSPEAKPSAFKVAAGRVAGKMMPHSQLVQRIPPEDLSSDPAVVKSLAEDKLCHNTGTLEGLAGLLDRAEKLSSGVTKVHQKGVVRAVWCGHGTQDKTTDFHESRKYFEKCLGEVEDKEFKAYEGWYHQLHADGQKSEEFYRDVGDWILARCEAQGGEGGEGEEVAESEERPTSAKL
ncbi:Alpha/Beta hydrolase protein [Diplogelasinospora grovesii]|uniref:Alpha/Beta hydrolase protein n=1 Tax=Diplogelasinospora grovesii TaxID=303347 RepID=A0AAN6NGC5_9PEZI|nr:Alpha/Beta hydrolase protein [Diplogelasinospora grovesii]